MRVQICPKCGTPMNVAFILYEKPDKRINVQCPKCHHTDDPKSGTVETLFLPDEDVVETRAGLEGVEAMVKI